MALVSVTGILRDAAGVAITSTAVEIRRKSKIVGQGGRTIVPTTIKLVTDSSGAISTNLEIGTYEIHALEPGQRWRGTLTIPSGVTDITIAEALEQAPEDILLATSEARQAATDAEAAQGASESARDASVDAQGASETARDASIVAQSASEAARDGAVAAAGGAVKNTTTTAPPTAPAVGDAYVVAAPATGAWVAREDEIATWTGASWDYSSPTSGRRLYNIDTSTMLVFDGADWTAMGDALDFSKLGINTTADATNRLSVSAAETLLNHEGAGHQIKLNKNAVGDAASLLYQSAGSGFAEMGLVGDNDFTVKTSDGAGWFASLKCNSANGWVSFPAGISGRISVYATGYSLFIGEGAGENDDLSNNYNVFVGYNAGNANTTGSSNSATGANALRSNTTGSNNSATGANALRSNTTGSNNSATGAYALRSNTTGSNNSGAGYAALRSNTTGSNNSGAGYAALYANTTGSNNSATGANALRSNTTGGSNSATGANAGRYTNVGADNAASNNSTYLGYDTRASASGNSNETVIGYGALGNGSNTVTMGNGGVVGAYIQVPWTVVSDRRDKLHLGDVPHGLDFVRQISSVAYRHTDGRGGAAMGPVRYGFYAQDVLALEAEPVIVNADDMENLKLNETAMIPVLVNAVKELAAQLEVLKITIEEMKNE